MLRKRMNEADLLALADLDYIAKYTDGHFTLMAFTTNYRVGLSTPIIRGDVEYMAEGKTVAEAVRKLFLRLSCHRGAGL